MAFSSHSNSVQRCIYNFETTNGFLQYFRQQHVCKMGRFRQFRQQSVYKYRLSRAELQYLSDSFVNVTPVAGVGIGKLRGRLLQKDMQLTNEATAGRPCFERMHHVFYKLGGWT